MNDPVTDAIILAVESHFLPKIKKLEAKIEVMEHDKFLRYPKDIMDHYHISKTTAYNLWVRKGFPKTEISMGDRTIKGVYLSKLKQFEQI